ncbi:MAG TPA: cytochrome P450 [Rhizomicrobium sp.]|jgi:hypothetical protein
MEIVVQASAVDEKIPLEIAGPLVDPASYASGAVLESYRWLRKNNPFGKATLDGFDPFWVVTRHADILEVSRRNDLFPYGDKSSTLTDAASTARMREITGGRPNLVRSLVQMDEPDHNRYRALTQAWFMPPSVRRREEHIRHVAEAAVNRLVDMAGRCDFVKEVALGYPLHIVMSILGIPETDEPRMLRLTQELFGPQDPDTARATAALSATRYAEILQATIDDFTRYFGTIVADRRESPRDDLASVIANARIGGDFLPDVETSSYFIVIATAGHDTTSSSIAAGMHALASDPTLLARIQNDVSLIPGFVDESIRWATPVKTFMRSASQSMEFAGRQIEKGDWVMLCYASGNRDEGVFEDPDVFRADRTPNRHLAFGYGAHLCLGQHLAKLEMRLFWEALIPRLKSVELDGEANYSASWFVNGLKTLPIRFELKPV